MCGFIAGLPYLTSVASMPLCILMSTLDPSPSIPVTLAVHVNSFVLLEILRPFHLCFVMIFKFQPCLDRNVSLDRNNVVLMLD